MNTAELRENFLISNLMVPGTVQLVYTHYDRAIIGGAVPGASLLELPNPAELRANYFLERRELGIINIGGPGQVITEKETYTLNKLDAVYLGKGTQLVQFKSDDASQPAHFYLASFPAHHTYPNRYMNKEAANPVHLGDSSTSNKRTIYKYIHNDGMESCQLVMGLTLLEPGSVWNSVPPHTHTRRMEVYFYFNLEAEHRVLHVMGEPQETRHIWMANEEAVISPPWSMHFGTGTSNYGFIWCMGGENKEFTDMDPAPIASLL